MKKLLDTDNKVRGYEHNGKYLLKHYTWGNKFDWIISNKDFIKIMSCEITDLFDNGTIKFVDSFKQGKEELLNN